MLEIIKIQPILAIFISVIALIIALKNYQRKTGVFVRGYFSTGSSIYGNDHYVSVIGLENLKDRSVTIYAIYLRIGHNYYVEIEDFENKPLILKPFETYHKEFGVIDFYCMNMRQISIDDLVFDRKTKKRLVLSTSDGRYIVPSNVLRWNPVTDFFRNHATAIIRPVRSTYKGQDLGANTIYVVELTFANGEDLVVPIHPTDYQVQRFRKIRLTKESLASKEALENLLRTEAASGNLICEKLEVHDVAAWRSSAHEHYEMQRIVARPYSAFTYYVLCRIGTIVSNRKMKKENKRQQEEFERRKQDLATSAPTVNSNEQSSTS